MTEKPRAEPRIGFDSGPAGGWGSAKSVTGIVLREHIPLSGPSLLLQQNKPDGYMCVSCAWAKPAKTHPLEFCESGAKATAWEITNRRTDEAFFAAHTLRELEGWLDHNLEEQGRLTRPMRWDPASDKYVPVTWETAFEEIGRELRQLDPATVEFYTSGRASLEAAYMYQLFARIYGSNNLPDSSNMCHESSSVGLPESIGATVGTAVLSDFENCDCIFYIAQNVATSSPRMLHDLQDAVDRGVKIVTFNLLREPGLERFVNPQAPGQMLTGKETPISSEYYQVRNGGDVAALFGVCKALIEADDAKSAVHATNVSGSDAEPKDESAAAVAFAASMAAADKKHVLDHDFIAEHTAGFEEFAAAARAHTWDELERVSGLTRRQMTQAARTYAASDAVLLIYGMGLTQHVMGVQNVQMVANLALLRGNIGKPGANICAVRGHSNVQGQRTVGITEKASLVPLDKLAELYQFEPPRWEGHSTVDACEAILKGETRGFVSLGGNFVRAIPDTEAMEAAWQTLRLTVQIATKLNRSHLIHGEVAYLLPCLGRLEIDQQATGPQAVSIESSVAHFHGSRGRAAPASPHLLSEPAIIAGMAKATLTRGAVPWDQWVADYSRIRDAIERTYPETLKAFNERLFQPGGIPRPVPARERKWVTSNKKANFITPPRLFPDFGEGAVADGVLNLATLRSNDQFNTTIYGYTDRYRGVDGTRQVVFVNEADIARLGFAPGDLVDLTTAIDPQTERQVRGFRLVAYDIPEGCCAAYYPEANPLFPLSHHDPKAKTPSYKLLPIRFSRSHTVPIQ
ncbi:FdhF/YdeP family oxidoreductase [Mycoplana dimorpha]|uniref:Molybdopterin-dependent oxidoreductase alpha subunit n=1 Tax=Mycoplana dimorpha TaxID=28320 RepID=A0A2T5BEE2_MYCDI|nr:FdhF/YdeP family oxidoreductase [Mycoplana dimorpha]PTM97330.1 molybdopterin-dependent oxidoreductase alpha subunit [Mycoplana dimorpha]